MSMDLYLDQFRVDAESLMVDTCAIRYPTGTTTQDETTGREVDVWAVRFTSPCKLQSRSTDVTVRTSDTAGVDVSAMQLELHLPVTAPVVKDGDVAEVTAVGAASDPQNLGRALRIDGPAGKTFATARRLQVEEVDPPWV